MNFKKFFYQDYYTKSFSVLVKDQNEQRMAKLEKPEDEERFKEIKKFNKPVFDKANDILINAQLSQDDLNLLKLNGCTTFRLKTVYPGLIIGSGYTHETNNEAEFKLGFFFDHTTGLPCLPGSGVKGTLRSAFPQFKTEKPNPFSAFKATTEIQDSKLNYMAGMFNLEQVEDKKRAVHLLELALFEGIDIAACRQKFDENKTDVIEYLSIYHRVIFNHAYISMTAGNKIFETDTITPHGEDPLKNPTPLNFLKIRPGVEFTFNFSIPQNIPVPGMEIDVSGICSAFKTILTVLGIGAKTNVGYGQFEEPPYKTVPRIKLKNIT